MEIDGKKFYHKLSQSSNNQLGRELFESLAAEEDLHRQKFEEIYEAVRNRKGWPDTNFQPDKGKKLRTIFAKAVEAIGSNIKAPANELEAIQTAITMESQSYDLYESRQKSAAYDAEKEFYQALAAEERSHHLVLLDYYEYLTDPAGWFVTKEHPSLDAG